MSYEGLARTADTRAALADVHGPGVGAKNGELKKIGYDLALVYREYLSFRKSGKKGRFSTSAAATVNSAKAAPLVLINAIAISNALQLLTDLQALGLEHGESFGLHVSGWLPIENLARAATLESLRYMRPSRPVKRVGLTTSQGDFAQRSNLVRPPTNPSGPTGMGIAVGTLSDSFNCQGGAASNVASGDLPAGIVVLEEEMGCGSASDEGRAMMQIIADVAPGASQLFHSAFNGEASFASGIIELANAGADVIVDDIGYGTVPMFQDGIIAQAVNTVAANGVVYFSAAANSGRLSYESVFRASSTPGPSGKPLHDFDPATGTTVLQAITIPSGVALALAFQWDEPSGSLGGPGATNDVDIFLLDPSATSIVAGSADDNLATGDPIEFFGFENTGPTAQFFLAIELFTGGAPGLMKYVVFNGAPVSIDAFNTASGTSFGHPNAGGAVAVGAAAFFSTPACGVSPPQLEDFSSAGGTPILFANNGTRLGAPIVRQKPEIVAPDAGNTTFFGELVPSLGSGSCQDIDGFPNFFGTSAAAPHAAGVAALMLEANGSLSPAALTTALENTAVNMGPPGFDFDSGFGLIQADAAVAAVTVPDGTPDQFTFADQDDVPLNSLIVSNTVTITNINTPVTISVAGGEYSIGCGAMFTATAGTINNNQAVCVRHTSAATNDTDTNTTLTVGGISDIFTSTTIGSGPDSTPNQFNFTDQTGVARNTSIVSAPITVTGINMPATVTVTGGEYSVGCTATFTAASGSANVGETICVRHTSSTSFSTAVNTVLTVGGVSDTFTSTTEALDEQPDPFTFTPQTNVALNTVVTSNTVTITGISGPVPITVTGGAYSIGCGAVFTAADGSIAAGETVCVRHTSASTGSTTVGTTLSVGGIAGIFTSTTLPTGGPVIPDDDDDNESPGSAFRGESGGGCTVAHKPQDLNPLWLLMLIAAAARIRGRRTHSMRVTA
ncbi:MAG: S8 family peptidase [Nevskiales bacterium]